MFNILRRHGFDANVVMLIAQEGVYRKFRSKRPISLISPQYIMPNRTYERIIKQKRYFPPSPQQTGRIFNRKLKPESCLSSGGATLHDYLF